MANSQSSRDPSLTGFDPENEALASTKRIGLSQGREALETVPELTEDLDYQIDTSVMDKHLPHFSSAEDEDADDDMSIEVGRGGKPFSKVEDSRDTMMSYDDSQIILSPAKLRSPVPLQSKTNRKSSLSKENLRKDASIRRASLAVREKDVAGKNKTRTANKSQRRTLADVHEKIKDAYDGSYLSDERPQARNVASKTTRFSKVQFPSQTDDIRQAVAQAAGKRHLQKESTTDHKNGGNNTNTLTDTQTRLSFALPDVENLSELVSGMLDSTPRHSSKSRTTRFASQPTSGPQQYASLDAVPIPDDEKIVFASLRHLQEQVAALKADRDRLELLEQENAALKSAKHQDMSEEERKPTYVSSDDNSHGQRPAKAAIERQRLEAANIALQGHLEQANSKVAMLETALKHAEQEKESALSQRGAAYFASRELKIRNEELMKTNEELQARVDMLTELLKSGGPMSRNDASEKMSMPNTAGGKQTPVDEPTTTGDKDLPLEGEETEASQMRWAKGMKKRTKIRSSFPTRTNSEEFAELFSIEIPFREQRSRSDRHRPKAMEEARISKNAERARFTTKRGLHSSKKKDGPLKAGQHAGRKFDDESQRDLTFLNFIDAQEIEKLRKALEEEKLMQQNKLLQRDVTMTGMQREPTVTNGLKSTLKRRKSDVTRTGVMVDETGRLADTGKSTQQLPAGEGACADNPTVNVGEDATKCSVIAKDTMKIPKPIPVSDRMDNNNNLVPANNDPTQRPAQPPAVALATVLKNLEDEVNQVKAQLECSQIALKNHDASMGKKHRKSLVKTIESLLHDIDVKSDQIYALYDVLEGQKAAGAEMTDEEVRINMKDIVGGTGENDRGKASGNDDGVDQNMDVYVDETVESWNGFEPSEEIPRSASRRKNSRVPI
ncbi:hypothetical protein KEM54_000554 [Ascosphaera aggregata]|nr:hypothetical protein KEM54_000554 [Ascosphaera aggregata]